jgi:hypothetical protein
MASKQENNAIQKNIIDPLSKESKKRATSGSGRDRF